MCSSTLSAPFFATTTETSACTRVYVFAPAAAASTSAAAATAARSSALRARRVTRGEADLRRRALGRVLDLEELALREPERAREQHGGEHLDRVVERQHGVVVDLARDRDLVLGVAQLALEVEEVLACLQVG